jgi:hypothetical protein
VDRSVPPLTREMTLELGHGRVRFAAIIRRRRWLGVNVVVTLPITCNHHAPFLTGTFSPAPWRRIPVILIDGDRACST